MKLFSAALLALGLCATADATVLTGGAGGNFDAETAGKTVFIKFYAPWCGHCKGMKPAWDQLMGEYEGHASILIGDVDCTTDDNKALCSQQGVKGYPTIKYGDPNALEDFKGGRDLAALQAHAATLGPSCSPSNIELCTEEKKAEIETLLALSEEELQTFVSEKEAELKSLEETFTAEVAKLQATYQELQKTKADGEEAVQASGFALRKSVLAHKKKTAAAGDHQEL